MVWWWITKKLSLTVVFRSTPTTSNLNFLLFWWDYCTAVIEVLNLLNQHLFSLSTVQLFGARKKTPDLSIKFWISPGCLFIWLIFLQLIFKFMTFTCFSIPSHICSWIAQILIPLCDSQTKVATIFILSVLNSQC